MTGRTEWYRRAGVQLGLLSGAVTVADAALGGPALWADVPRTDADLRLREAQGGPPGRLLAAAADHALASGSAELELSVNDFQYVHGDRKRAPSDLG
ncbi:hypothetical protein [Streptomyces sp. NPDC086023]|uniref:hypothetical protein n=1 Tax=Streptomyces sp. NPDC086023 TaxID=3365746 RepID=UPI0037D6370D